MDKTNLITIIGSKQTDYSKMIRESIRLSGFDICIQNLLYSNKLDLDNKLFKNVIVVIFSKDDNIEDKTIKDMLLELSLTKVPIFVLLEEDNNTNTEDDIKIHFAKNSLVPKEWGGYTLFVNNYNTDALNLNLEDYLYIELYYYGC